VISDLGFFVRLLYGLSARSLACSGLSRLPLEGCSEDREKLIFNAEFSNPEIRNYI
jgi:hypothetical protein